MSSLKEIESHIAEVQMAAAGAQTRRETLIEQSWRRCVNDHGLDPTDLKDPYIVPQGVLREHRDRIERLIHTARNGLETLYKQVNVQNYVLLLTDAQGVTVDYMGDPQVDDDLRAAGLYLGAEWSESRAGTNGVGSCIETGEALIVHQTDHFDGTHTSLTCTAAPIHDVDGRLAAVLDISALHSPEPKESQWMALQLAKSCAQRIEMANLMASFRSEMVIRFSRSPFFLDVDPEFAVAIGPDGRVVGMTHQAQRLLSDSSGLGQLSPGDIIGADFSRFCRNDVNELPGMTRARPAEERSITLNDGTNLFAHAILPQSPPRRAPAATVALRRESSLHGGDTRIAAVEDKAERLANVNVSLLITGETGTGKEYLARAIHGMRKSEAPFVAINCAAMPETLIESELFGYESGAFTGARSKGKRGLIEAADGGTLFLDEIGDMPLALQARLLRVLAEKEVLPVGATSPKPVNIRVMAATHRNLAELARQGKFRDDLFYRLNGAVLELPPLREREDFDWLAARVLNSGANQGGQMCRISPRAMMALRQHDWPGNIRELQHALEFARAFATLGVVEPADLPDTIAVSAAVTLAASETETPSLPQMLAYHGWNVSATARSLGVDRTTIHRRMRKAGIVPPNRRR